MSTNKHIKRLTRSSASFWGGNDEVAQHSDNLPNTTAADATDRPEATSAEEATPTYVTTKTDEPNDPIETIVGASQVDVRETDEPKPIAANQSVVDITSSDVSLGEETTSKPTDEKKDDPESSTTADRDSKDASEETPSNSTEKEIDPSDATIEEQDPEASHTPKKSITKPKKRQDKPLVRRNLQKALPAPSNQSKSYNIDQEVKEPLVSDGSPSTPATQEPTPKASSKGDKTKAKEPQNDAQITKEGADPKQLKDVKATESAASKTKKPKKNEPTAQPKQSKSNGKPTSSKQAKNAKSKGSAKQSSPKKPAKVQQPPIDDNASPFVRKCQYLWFNHRIPVIAGGSILVLLIVIYIAGCVYFSSHYLPNTTVNGKDVSLKSSNELANEMSSAVQNYTAHISGDGVNLTLSGSDVNLALDVDTYIDASRKQVISPLWPIAPFSKQTYLVNEGISLDESKLKSLVTPQIDKVNKNSTPTTNATAAYDSDTGDYVTVPEALGTELDPTTTLSSVATSVKGLNDTITLGDSELVQPTVSAGDPKFGEALRALRSYPDLSIDLIMGGESVQTLDSDLIKTWLTIKDDFSITADPDAVAYYTRFTLSSKLDSVGAYRTYTRPDGKKIQINDGTYGWSIDGIALAELIVDSIDAKSSDKIEVPCISTANVYDPGGADWGGRYIDVDLTEQYARMYDGGSLVWESLCVSGGSAEGNDTVTGVFAIEDKRSPEKLIGLDSNGDGEPDYENDVTYWMPFFGGYGLHDATWRYTFGGDEYLYNGSHGCVNLPYDAAEMLYFTVEVGDAVIVHW